jgi:CubicO group peptidase (beta-lactamase class C family)
MLRRLLIATSLAAFFSIASAAPDPKRMDQIALYYVGEHQFMGSVLVAQGDQVLFRKSYGSADLEWNIPNTPTTKFRIGSITKQFTAVAILLLAERGKLELDDPIRKYYADAPAAWNQVTLLHLLNHTSGIHSYTDDPAFDTFTRLPATPAEIVKRVQDKPLDFETGKDFRYSNTGYILLGIVIEKVSGMSYADFLKSQVLDPLGLENTGYDVNTAILPQRAEGHVRRDGKILRANYIDMTIPYAAGSLYSTVEDLLRWQRGLYGGKLISKASLEKLTTVGRNDYALGVVVRSKDGVESFSHGGGINGFNSQLAWYPKTGVTVVALSNLNGPGADSIGEKLGALMHGSDVVLPSERKTVAVPKEILEKYVGEYQLRPGFSIRFFVRDGQLISQATGQPEFPLVAESNTVFRPTAFEARLEFQLDDQGIVTGVVNDQNGNKTLVKKIR